MTERNIDMMEDLKKIEESFWLPADLRKRYRAEFVEMLHTYDKLSREENYDDPIMKSLLASISLHADRLLELTTNVTYLKARDVALQLELSQFPLEEETEETIKWYADNTLRAMAHFPVEMHDGTKRCVLFSPNAQIHNHKKFEPKAWLYSPKRIFMRAIELVLAFRG